MSHGIFSIYLILARYMNYAYDAENIIIFIVSETTLIGVKCSLSDQAKDVN
jgi:hypothetical protein